MWSAICNLPSNLAMTVLLGFGWNCVNSLSIAHTQALHFGMVVVSFPQESLDWLMLCRNDGIHLLSHGGTPLLRQQGHGHSIDLWSRSCACYFHFHVDVRFRLNFFFFFVCHVVVVVA
jgi:hypothetical protein